MNGLYRGQRESDGKWVIGYYVVLRYYLTYEKTHCIVGLNNKMYDDKTATLTHKIIPNTLGGFTGKTDKYDTKIFHGDILKKCNEINYYVVVEWSDERSAFVITEAKSLLSKVEEINDKSWSYMENWKPSEWEVVGNIYDNKSLLGE